MANKFQGVRTQERYNKRGKKDIYFSIRYMRNGKQCEEGIGYKSEGFTAKEVYDILCELKKDIQAGRALSLKDKKNQQEQQKKANEEALKQELLKDMTFTYLFEEYYKPHIKLKNKKSTYEREVSLYKRWLKPFFGGVKLSLISRISLISILNEMKTANLSNRTQNYAIALTRQVFNFAIKEELFSGNNPAAKFDFPKTDNKRMRFLTDEELDKLFTELKKRSYRVYLMALLSADSGLRAGEIFNLTWADVNLQQRTIFIKDPKNGKNRHAYMTIRVFEEFSKLKQGLGNKLVFPNKNGNKFEHVSRTFERAVKACQLNKGYSDRRQKVVFHSLRHTFASRLVQKGVSLYEVKELLGHSDIKMTMRYAHLSNETLRQAISKLDE